MTEEQLQLLRAARPSGEDELDPAVMEARAAAAVEPEVLALLMEEREMDLAMRRALTCRALPAGLESRLLTAMRAAHGAVEPPASLLAGVLQAVQIPPGGAARPSAAPPASRREWLRWGAAAAAAVVAGGAAFAWRQSQRFSMQQLAEALAGISRKGVTLSIMSMDPDVISGWLYDHDAPRATTWPARLAALPRKGCHLYHLKGHPVSLECLVLPGMKLLHLFTTPTHAVQDAPPPDAPPALSTVSDHTLAAWSRDGYTMLMISHETAASVLALFA